MVKVGEVIVVKDFIYVFSFGDCICFFLKVQDGCDYKCFFCIILLVCGKSCSNMVESVVVNVWEIVKMGICEVVLIGVNIGDFGNGMEVIEGICLKKEVFFIDLIQELDQVEGIECFWILSIEFNFCNEEIIVFVVQF